MVSILEQTDNESRSEDSEDRAPYDIRIQPDFPDDDSEEGLILFNSRNNVYQDEFSNRPTIEKVKCANKIILTSIKSNIYSCCKYCYSKRNTSHKVHGCYKTLKYRNLGYYVTSGDEESTANWLTHLKVLLKLRRLEKGRPSSHTIARITSMFTDELGDRAYNGMFFSAKASLLKVLKDLHIIKSANMSGVEIVDLVLMSSENKIASNRPWSILRTMSYSLLEAITYDIDRYVRTRIRRNVRGQWLILERV